MNAVKFPYTSLKRIHIQTQVERL